MSSGKEPLGKGSTVFVVSHGRPGQFRMDDSHLDLCHHDPVALAVREPNLVSEATWRLLDLKWPNVRGVG